MTDTTTRLTKAYNQMLETTKEIIDLSKREGAPAVLFALDEAKEKVAETMELTGEEIEKISDYVVRDLHDAAEYIAVGERELGDWLRIDALYIESSLLDMFSHMVDETALALNEIKLKADEIGVWNTGEITGIGTLACKDCGEILQFKTTGPIPHCPKCNHTEFKRS